MNLLKKFLRGVFYFCVGVRAAARDLTDWYTHNRAIPGFLRHPVVLLVVVVALVGCSCGLAAAIGSSSLEERHVPSSSQAASQPEEPADNPADEGTPPEGEGEPAAPEAG